MREVEQVDGMPRRRGFVTRVGSALAVAGVVAMLAGSCAKGNEAATSTPGTTPANEAAKAANPPPKDEGPPQDGGKLVFGVDAEPDGFDPAVNQLTSTSLLIGSSVLEGLVAFDADRNAKPFLAESVEPKDLAAKWVFTMKPNITFHDGTPLDAEAVKANLTATSKGIGSIGFSNVSDMKVVSPLVLEVSMKKPWASFPSLLAGTVGLLESPKVLGTPEASTKPVGTGPFVFDKWDHGSGISVRKNDTYWNKGKPHLDSIEYRFLSDPATRASSLASGEIDGMITDQVSTINEYKNKSDFRTIIDQSGDAAHVFMNQGQAPFDDVNARKAVVLATDNKALTEQIGAGLLAPIDQPFDDRSAYHQDDPHYPKHDLEAAKKAAADYKAKSGKDLAFTLTVFAGSSNLAMAQVLAEQWAQAGIKAEINSVEQAAAIKELIVGKFEAAISFNYGFPDPDFNYIFWHSSYTGDIGALSINFAHLKDPDIDAQLDEGRTILVPSLREAAYQKAVQMMNEKYTYAWLYRYLQAMIVSNRVKGLDYPATVGFAAVSAKPFWGDVWIQH